MGESEDIKRDEVLKRMLNTPPKPHEPKGRKIDDESQSTQKDGRDRSAKNNPDRPT